MRFNINPDNSENFSFLNNFLQHVDRLEVIKEIYSIFKVNYEKNKLLKDLYESNNETFKA